MATSVALTEAVIISGPRRGEIIRLEDDMIPEVTQEEIAALNAALDDLDAALDRAVGEVRAAADAFREDR